MRVLQYTDDMVEMVRLMQMGDFEGALRSKGAEDAMMAMCRHNDPVFTGDMGVMTTEEYRALNEPLAVVTDIVELSPDTMESDIKALADRASNAPLNLIAPTGSGKTTKLPLALASETVGTVVVVEPTIGLAANVYDYVVTQNQGKVDIDDGAGKFPGAPVVYTSTSVFCTRLLKNTDFGGVTTVILDEAHTGGLYDVLRPYLYVKGARWKVYYVSATLGGRDVESLRTGFHNSVARLEGLSLRPFSADRDSPAAPSAIKGTVLIVLPSRDDVHEAERYYNDAGLHAVSLNATNTLAEYRTVRDFIVSFRGRNIVLIVDASYGAGYTFDVQRVLTPSLCDNSIVDTEARTLRTVLVPMTRPMVTQVIGRVGRIAPGSAFVGKSGEKFDVQWFDCYKYLWLVALGINPSKKYGTIARLLGNGVCVSRSRALTMLKLRVHPYLSSFYLDGDRIYSNYYDVIMEFAVPGAEIGRSDRTLKPDDTWFEIRGFSKLEGVSVPLNPKGSYYPYLMLYLGLRGKSVASTVFTVPSDSRFTVTVPSNVYATMTDTVGVESSSFSDSATVISKSMKMQNVLPESSVAKCIVPSSYEYVPDGRYRRLESRDLDFMCGFLRLDGSRVTTVRESLRVFRGYLRGRNAEMIPDYVRFAAVHIWNDAFLRFSLAGGMRYSVIHASFPYYYNGKVFLGDSFCLSKSSKRKFAMSQAKYVSRFLVLVSQHYNLWVQEQEQSVVE